MARRYAATDEVSLDLEALPAVLEAVVTFPPHPPRCARHLLLKEKAAHDPTVPAGSWPRGCAHRGCEGAYRRLHPKRLSSGGARGGFSSLPLEGKVARRYAATDEVSLDLEALPAVLEAVAAFPPHPPRCARHLLLKEKAAHDPTVPAGRSHKKYRPPKRVIGIFGGGRWIRTIEGIASRFTVCPLWPLGNSPICNLSEGGAGRRTRTPDLLITNQLLYQLSYTSTTPAYVS